MLESVRTVPLTVFILSPRLLLLPLSQALARAVRAGPCTTHGSIGTGPVRRSGSETGCRTRALARLWTRVRQPRSEEHTFELQSRRDLVCRLLLEKKKKKNNK